MAIVKFVPAGSPLNNIFDYVMRDEATEDKSTNSDSSNGVFTRRTAGATTISCSRSHPMTTSLQRLLTRSD